MDQEALKKRLASHAAKTFKSEEMLGVGGGTTVEYFIEALAQEQQSYKSPLVIASTKASKLAKSLGFQVISWRSALPFDIYIDGTDFISLEGYMIKGKGGAALGEKIVSSLTRKFICLYDHSKEVQNLSQRPIYIEVLPKASSIVAKELLKRNISVSFIDKYSENDYWIMEARVQKWDSLDATSSILNSTPGIISHGLFTQKATIGMTINSSAEISSVEF